MRILIFIALLAFLVWFLIKYFLDNIIFDIKLKLLTQSLIQNIFNKDKFELILNIFITNNSFLFVTIKDLNVEIFHNNNLIGISSTRQDNVRNFRIESNSTIELKHIVDIFINNQLVDLISLYGKEMRIDYTIKLKVFGLIPLTINDFYIHKP